MSSDKPTTKRMGRLGAQRTTNQIPPQTFYAPPYVAGSSTYDQHSSYAIPEINNSYTSPINDPYAATASSFIYTPEPLNPKPDPYANMPPQTFSSFQSPMPNFDPSIINNPIVGQFLQSQVSNFSSDLVNKGKSWFDSFKYLFAVDTAYVLKKLCLLLFPFAQKDWLVKYASSEPVAPRDDLNVPDLYIPSMAFVTYVLLAGYLLGLKSLFSPEILGMQASFALFWLLFEVICSVIGLHLIGIKGALGFFNLLSYCSYKFVFMIVCLLTGLIFKTSGYWIALAYCSLALGYFLIRSLNVAIQTGQSQLGNKPGVYLVMGLSLFQPLLMFLMTRHLVYSPV